MKEADLILLLSAQRQLHNDGHRELAIAVGEAISELAPSFDWDSLESLGRDYGVDMSHPADAVDERLVQKTDEYSKGYRQGLTDGRSEKAARLMNETGQGEHGVTPADPLTVLRAIDKEAEYVVQGGVGYLLVTKEMMLRLYAALATKPAETDKVKRMQDAIEGECDGLAIMPEQARAILEYVDGHPTESAGKSPEAAGDLSELTLAIIDLANLAYKDGREEKYPWSPEWQELKRLVLVGALALAETQRSSHTARSDEPKGTERAAVQPPAPEPHRLSGEDAKRMGLETCPACDEALHCWNCGYISVASPSKKDQ